jgi:phosphoribosylglycinamide formyltransferase-1
VLCSGGGTTLQNFIDRIAAGRLNAAVVGVIVGDAHAGARARAEKANLPVEVVSPQPTDESSKRIFALCRSWKADLVLLAGYLHLLKIPADFLGRVMNIHPSLIPAFSGKGYYGLRVHRAALDRGVKVSGCTVHFADNEYDAGPIVLQKVVPVLDGDDAETLAARVFAAECDAYPEAVELFAAGKLRIEGRRVRVG